MCNGLQIRTLINDDDSTNGKFLSVLQDFLRNHKAAAYFEMLRSFQKLEANVNFKIFCFVLFSHLDRFPNNLDDYSEEQGEQFHLIIKIMRKDISQAW